MKLSIHMKIITVLVVVLLSTACGGDKPTQAPPVEQKVQTLETTIAAAAEGAAQMEEML